MYTLPKASSCPDTHWLSTLTDPEMTALSVSSMVLPSVRVSLPAMRSFRVGERMAARYSFGTSYIFVVILSVLRRRLPVFRHHAR